MNLKTEELLIITLAVVIFIAIFIAVDPAFIGYATYEFSNFTNNDNFIINETLQLKQHNLTETSTSVQTYNYNLTLALYDGKTKMPELEEFDDKYLEIDKKLGKIKFNQTLEDGDIINTYLRNDKHSLLIICNFNAENTCENETIYSTLDYNGQEGFYQFTLSLQQPTDEFAVESINNKTKFNHFNASHLEITEHTDITYYYNSDFIETEIIQPENLEKWDVFLSNYILNNQNISFYYKTNQEFIEFTPPFNFSSINSSSLKFKLELFSDNTSTPIIYNLSINYVEQNNETIEEPVNEIIEETPPSPGKPSLTRYKYSSPTQVKQTKITETKSIPIRVETIPEKQETIQETFEKTPNKLRITMNVIALSYLTFVCLLLYKRRHKL